ncbi:MAG: NADH-quinone oxidoreductase subunit C [Candidatus Wallbacteria bacterium]|nr:NADH-quinone oxidoreductase subunit C [Candidatus Wallbacteria bacterium]
MEPRDFKAPLLEKFPFLAEFAWRSPFPSFYVPADRLLGVASFLRDDLGFDLLADLAGLDCSELGRTPRFEVVYNFYSITHKDRVFLKVAVEEAQELCEVPTMTGLYATANWYEREVWDMFGVRFTGHPYLKRILLYEGFEGHPLRKDYDIRHRQPLVPGAD